MKKILNGIGNLLSFSFIEKWAIGRGVHAASAFLVGLLYGPTVAGAIPPLPGDAAAWQAFFSAALAGLYAAGVKIAKHYGAPKP